MSIDFNQGQLELIARMTSFVRSKIGTIAVAGIQRRHGNSRCIAFFASRCEKRVCVVTTSELKRHEMETYISNFGNQNVECFAYDEIKIENTNADVLIFDSYLHTEVSLQQMKTRAPKIIMINSN